MLHQKQPLLITNASGMPGGVVIPTKAKYNGIFG
jgi:hypothetical protein